MFTLDGTALIGIAAIITSLSKLVLAWRDKARDDRDHRHPPRRRRQPDGS